MKRIFVTGGTGFVGAHVVRKLVERGDHVTALVRPNSDTSLLNGIPVEKVTGDITDMDTMLWPIRRCEELYHIAADYRLWAPNSEEIYFNNIAGTLNVMEAALRSGVGTVVYTSTVGCLGIPNDGSLGNEETPVERNQLVGHYKKSKFDAEQVAMKYANNGLNVIIVNPSTPVGPGDIKPTPTGRIILDFLKGGMRGFIKTGLNLIAVEDVAEGHLLAAKLGKPGERYILGNANITLQELLGILASITGRTAPGLEVPYWTALIAAASENAICRLTGMQPKIPMEGVLMAKKMMHFSAQKAVSEIGLKQSSIEEALQRSVKWFFDNGYTKQPRR